MLAMNYRGPYRVRVDEKPMPVILHPEDAIIRVTRSCICGSDLHLYHGMVPDTRVGMTFGHEFCGVVEEVGPEVRNLKRGDHVLVPFNIACGICHFCQQGLFGNCHESNAQATAVGGIYGYSHTAGGYDGGQAQYVRVPYADVGPTVIPDWMDPDDAVLLTDVVPTGYQAAEMGGITRGDTVVVFGAGPVGLMAARSACNAELNTGTDSPARFSASQPNVAWPPPSAATATVGSASGDACVSASAKAQASSSVCACRMPACANAPDASRASPASAPVWDTTARRPASVSPGLSTITGLVRGRLRTTSHRARASPGRQPSR